MSDGYISRKAAILAIRSIPDAVVYCGECEQYAEKVEDGYSCGFCKRINTGVGAFDFCSRGVRREKECALTDINVKNIDKIRKLDAEQLGSILAYAMVGLTFSRKTDNWFFKEFSQFYVELRKVQDTSGISVREAVIMWLKKEADDAET